MNQSNSSFKALTKFYTQSDAYITLKTSSLNHKLYFDLLNTYTQHQQQANSQQTLSNAIQQPQINFQFQYPSLKLSQTQPVHASEQPFSQQQNQPQTLPINTLFKTQQNNAPQSPQNSQTDSPIIHTKKSLKLKPNPRMHKFVKQQKHFQQQTNQQNGSQKQKQKELQQKMDLQKILKQRALELQQLKQKQLKKIQLKQKLRKLNNQLHQEKEHLRSQQKQRSFFEANEENPSFTNPQKSYLANKLSSSFMKDLSMIQKSGMRSRSDAEFRVKKLKQQQAVYTPLKHEAAFKLIEKMHAEKLKKQQKIVREMKMKQQREIEQVKRLEEERLKERHLKRVRQVLYYTPKVCKIKKIPQMNQSVLARQKSMEMKGQTVEKKKLEFLKPESIKGRVDSFVHEQPNPQQQISLVIPHSWMNQNPKNQRPQTLYTQQFQQQQPIEAIPQPILDHQQFNPTTQQGKQFAEALFQSSSRLNSPSSVKEQQLDPQEHPQDNHYEQIVADNQFI